MGKTKPQARRKRRKAAQRRKTAKDDLDSLSVEELLVAAQEEMDNFQYEAAQTLCRTALQKEPDNVAVLETSASLCLEAGNLDGARHCLGRAITVQPESGHEKYMSMAQLMEGREALTCYQKGIEIITRRISNLPSQDTITEADSKAQEKEEAVVEGGERGAKDIEQEKIGDPTMEEGNENLSPAEGVAGSSKPPSTSPSPQTPQKERAKLVRQASTAQCCVAELYMTDLCDEEEAEETCRTTITTAIHLDPTNPEAYQHMASFLLVKQELEEAKSYMAKSLEVWLPQYKAVREGKAEAGTFDPVEVCPLAFGTRLTTARILIEIEDHTSALEVLEGLAEEDDEVVDVWYLMGWSHYLQGEEQRDAAHYCLHRALQVHSDAPCEDDQLVEHLKELMEELGPYTEKEEPDHAIEEELDNVSEEEEEEEAANDETMDTS